MGNWKGSKIADAIKALEDWCYISLPEAREELKELIKLAELGEALEYYESTDELIEYDGEDKLCVVIDNEFITLLEYYRRNKNE